MCCRDISTKQLNILDIFSECQHLSYKSVAAYLESSKVQFTISNQFCSFLPESDRAVLSPALCQTLTGMTTSELILEDSAKLFKNPILKNKTIFSDWSPWQN